MTKLINLVGRLAYYPLLPLMGFFLHNTRRVRVLVKSEQRVLLLRSRLGLQKWSLPGGGVNEGENPMDAAVRELYEETGITVDKNELNFIGELRIPQDTVWPRYDALFYVVHLKDIQEIEIHSKYEIIDVKWYKDSALPKRLGTSTAEALKLFKKYSEQ